VAHPHPLWLDDAAQATSLAPGIVRGTAVVTGNFDGVHRGHQALFARALAEAEARQLLPVALTFDPHPREVLGNVPPPRLTSTSRRVELIDQLGVKHIFIRRFDRAFAAWPAERFVEQLLVRGLHARVVIAGDNFHFGAARTGNDALLQRMGPPLGFEAFTLEATDARGALSSTRVREAVLAGNVLEAAEVLGRPHSIAGVVEGGERLGRTIGFPTANLGGVTELTPPDGVYAVAIDRLGDEGAVALGTGVMNLGVRPTVGAEARRTLEAHVFDFQGDLYGQALRVHFIARLRSEQKFDSLGALKAQIARDVERARAATRATRPVPERGSYG
jgi:riboflavin kinase/FMN adenylyltransferase